MVFGELAFNISRLPAIDSGKSQRASHATTTLGAFCVPPNELRLRIKATSNLKTSWGLGTVQLELPDKLDGLNGVPRECGNRRANLRVLKGRDREPRHLECWVGIDRSTEEFLMLSRTIRGL